MSLSAMVRSLMYTSDFSFRVSASQTLLDTTPVPFMLITSGTRDSVVPVESPSRAGGIHVSA